MSRSRNARIINQIFRRQPGGYRSLYALDFDGIDDVVSILADVDIANVWATGGTILCWVYVRSDGQINIGNIANKRNGGVGWTVRVKEEAAGKVKLHFLVDFSGALAQWEHAATAITLNTWTFVAVTYSGASDSNNPIFYINIVQTTVGGGGIINTTPPSGTIDDDSANAMQLGSNTGISQSYDGLIADVALLDRILTVGEIAEGHNNGVPIDLRTSSFASNLIYYVPMGLGITYPTLTDVINANNGTMTNMSAGDIVAGVNG